MTMEHSVLGPTNRYFSVIFVNYRESLQSFGLQAFALFPIVGSNIVDACILHALIFRKYTHASIDACLCFARRYAAIEYLLQV